MAETPMPEPLAMETDLGDVGGDGSRQRRRLLPTEGRALPEGRSISAIAPARRHGVAGPLTLTEVEFVSALHEAGLATELDGAELLRAAAQLETETIVPRRLDLLSAYYSAAGDPMTQRRRRYQDRWFLYSTREGLNANALVARIVDVFPELASARLERIGGAAGALILRRGEHVCALEDEREDVSGSSSVSVQDLVRAFNVLLSRHGIHTRLVGLLGDGQREAYVAQSTIASALALADAGYLQAPDAEALISLTAW